MTTHPWYIGVSSPEKQTPDILFSGTVDEVKVYAKHCLQIDLKKLKVDFNKGDNFTCQKDDNSCVTFFTPDQFELVTKVLDAIYNPDEDEDYGLLPEVN